MSVLVVACALLGLLIGPLLRLAVDQIPPRRPLLRRRTSADGAPVALADLVPVRSWRRPAPAATLVPVGSPDDHPDGSRDLVRMSWRAPAIDVATAVVGGALAATIGTDPYLPAALVLGWTTVLVTVIDLDHYRIPDRVVFPALGASVLLLGVVTVAADLPRGAVGALLGALAYAGMLFVMFLISPAGMGFGDVKLALLLGLHLGWVGGVSEVEGDLVVDGLLEAVGFTFVGALVGTFLGIVLGLGYRMVRGRGAAFPFGPALGIGTVVAVLARGPLGA
ncbi:prepilin peptidase [Actinomarinicola tropica]|uniref:Prepilin type IV endopeptidase peptidase domain-containing protein n=1 Tax=Actinomarinicola tropica TaxID=2789776 RepID=A0A5Q2RMP6_9ACTN|nr:A24 family peptidase [Actinomarinicola tropica]QGG95170.1 hypothetical protein GH723_08695 [Actinomarinicola tropica]